MINQYLVNKNKKIYAIWLDRAHTSWARDHDLIFTLENEDETFNSYDILPVRDWIVLYSKYLQECYPIVKNFPISSVYQMSNHLFIIRKECLFLTKVKTEKVPKSLHKVIYPISNCFMC